MRRAIFILCSIFFGSVVAFAQADNIELQSVNNEKLTLSPGVINNLVIRLANHTIYDEMVALTLGLPKGWKCFSEQSAILVPKEQSILKIFSFNIPSYAQAGLYSVTINGVDSHGVLLKEIVIPIIVEPNYLVKIELVHGPEYVFAGDTFTVQFVLQNLSNSKVELVVVLKGLAEDEKLNVVLNPDSSLLITRKIVAEKDILKTDKKGVSITASIVGLIDKCASYYYSYKLVPGSNIKFDPYNRFPVKSSVLFATDNSGGKREFALLAEIEGKGFLNDKNTKALNFHLRGPDRRGNPLYGIYDEYFIEYLSPKAKYLLGDHTYMLSYLTEFSRYGRGVRAEQSFNHITIGSFISFPRFYPQIIREFAVYSRYTLPKKLNLGVGYLNKAKNDGNVYNLMSLTGAVTPFDWAKVDLEYALGTLGTELKQAYKTEVRINTKRLSLFYHLTWADKDFPGYFNDTRNILADGNIAISKRINVGANYSAIHENMALDTLYGTAPLSKNLNFNFNFAIIKGGRLSTGYNYRERQDRMDPMRFNYNERSIRLNFNQRFSNLGFDLLGEYGKTENLLLPSEERLNDMYHGQFNINYLALKKMNVACFASYQQNDRYLINDHNNWTYGVSFNGSISKQLSLFLNYQSSFEIEEYYRNRSILDGRLVYTPNINNAIEILSRYDLKKNSLDVKELFLMVRYTHTFNVPISKKKNIGSLSGTVLNQGVNNIAGIIFSIGSDQAVTDKSGNFRFPMLPAGKYYLNIDYIKAGVFAIPDMPGPYEVEILPGQETRFTIGLTLTAKITGAISILKDVSDEDKSYAGIREHLGKLLVEAKSGEEVYRIFTKEDGTFAFESLRPGTWIVKVYDRGIPKEYQLVTDLFNVGLTSGETEHIEVKIKEVRRRIKFQGSFSNTVAPVIRPSKPKSPPLGMADPPAAEEQVKPISLKSKDASDTRENVEYRIQLGAYARPLLNTSVLAEKFKVTEMIKEDYFNGNYIYTIGSYSTQRQALLSMTEIQKNANEDDTFIVSFRNGMRTVKLVRPSLALK